MTLRPAMRPLVCIFVLLLAAMGLAQTGKVGNLTFKVPDGFELTVQGGVANMRPTGLAAGKSVVISLTSDKALSGDFKTAADQAFEAYRAGRNIARGSDPQFVEQSGVKLALRAIAFATEPESYGFHVAFAANGRFASVSLTTNDYELFEKYEPVVIAFMDTIDSATSSTPSTSTGTGKTEDAIAPELPARLAPELAFGANWDAEADNLAKIIAENKPEALAALHTAARAAGFGIRDNERREISKARAEANGLFVTEADLIYAIAMEKLGWGLDWAGFSDMNATAARLLGVTANLDKALIADLTAAHASQMKGRRFYARFIEALGKHRKGATFTEIPDGTAKISPVQYLFISRVMFGMGQKKVKDLWVTALKQNEALFRPHPAIAPFRQQATVQLEGYEQDTAAWGLGQLNQLFVEVFKNSGIGEAGLEKYSKAFGTMSGLASIYKFFATYLCLEAKFEVVDSPPLVRTPSHFEDGERKTVRCTIVSNPGRAERIMKDYRYLFAIFGLDSDMPSAGPLSGVETAWSLPDQPMAPSKQFVRFVGSDVLRIPTDASGTAECDVTGVKQRTQIDTKKATQINRSARIWVTPQVKAVTMQQDLTDASLNAFGIFSALGGVSLTKLPGQWSVDGVGKGEAVGFIGAFLTPVMETFYRGKWLMPLGYRLPVRDWGYAGLVGSIKVIVAGSGNEAAKDTSASWKFNRQISIEEIVLARTSPPLPTDPAALAAMGDRAFQIVYTESEVIPHEYTVNDEFIHRWMGATDCLDDTKVPMVSRQTHQFPVPNLQVDTPRPRYPFQLKVDTRTKSYTLQIDFSELRLPVLGTDSFTEKGVVKRNTSSPTVIYPATKLETYDLRELGLIKGQVPIKDGEIPDSAELSGSITLEANYRTPLGKIVKIPINVTWAFVNFMGGFEEQELALGRSRMLLALQPSSILLAGPVTLGAAAGTSTEPNAATCTPVTVTVGSGTSPKK